MEQVKAIWKYWLSFRKREWTVEDYPIRISQPKQLSGIVSEPSYRAQVINWWTLNGLGDTPEAAMADLQRSLASYQQRHGDLPRPGTKMPITFAPTTGIEAHAVIAERFLTEVLGFGPEDPVFISDESCLSDFEGVQEGVDLAQKVQAVFGVDISDIPDGNLLHIFERIEQGC